MDLKCLLIYDFLCSIIIKKRNHSCVRAWSLGVTKSVFPSHGHPIWLQNKLSYSFEDHGFLFVCWQGLSRKERHTSSILVSGKVQSLSPVPREQRRELWELRRGAENCAPGIQGVWVPILICFLTSWQTGWDCFIIDNVWEEMGSLVIPLGLSSFLWGFYPISKSWGKY